MASSLQERMETIITCGRIGYTREMRQMNLTDVALKEIQQHTGCLENYKIQRKFRLSQHLRRSLFDSNG